MAKQINIDYYLSAQPDLDYYIWQLQVQMNNFKKLGIEEKAIILLGYDVETGVSQSALEFQKQTTAQIFFIEDTRNEIFKSYVSTIRPHIIKNFYENHGSILKNKNFLYHDSDILFARLPKIEYKGNSKKILLSDTISYIGAEYIKSKSVELFYEMCNIVGIDSDVVSKNENKSGGAQYLISKNTPLDYDFWNKVEHDCVLLYHHMQNTRTRYNPNHPIQSWTSDMWALLWNLWLRGYDSDITKELNFSWATSHISEWDKNPIFHNAGVTPDRSDLFFKGAYIKKFPYGDNFDKLSNDFCSYKYVQEIIETGIKLNKTIFR